MCEIYVKTPDRRDLAVEIRTVRMEPARRQTVCSIINPNQTISTSFGSFRFFSSFSPGSFWASSFHEGPYANSDGYKALLSENSSLVGQSLQDSPPNSPPKCSSSHGGAQLPVTKHSASGSFTDQNVYIFSISRAHGLTADGLLTGQSTAH